VTFTGALRADPQPVGLSEVEQPVLVDACAYPTLESARVAWAPLERDTPPVEQVVEGGRSRLALRLNFATNDTWRVSWDRIGQWDLSACQTIRVDASVSGDRPAGLILYLHSGGGWYRANVSAVPGEETVELPRKEFTTEDMPGGWDRIDRIRLSVLREDGAERRVLLSGIAGIARPAHVVVYRNDAGVRNEPGVPDYVRRMGDTLDRLSISYEILGDREVAAGRLAGKKIAILPLNPVLPQKAAAGLEAFVAGGGKLIVCYRLSAPVDRLLGIGSVGTLQGDAQLHSFSFTSTAGRDPITVVQNSWLANRVMPGKGTDIRAVWTGTNGVPSKEPAITSNAGGFFIGHVLTPGDEPHKDLLIQELVGELWPGMWQGVCRTRAANLGKVAGFKNEVDLRKAILANRATSGNEKVLDNRIAEADRLTDLAKAALRDTANPARASECLAHAHEALTQAYATSVAPRTGEFRAVWCHSPTGVSDLTWDEAMKRLADAGFTAIIPNLCWGDSAAYKSTIVPRAPDIERDELAECLAAARKHGIAVHVWRVNWNLFGRTEPRRVAELRAAGRLQVDRAGKPVDWLCPSNPENQKLELDALLEIARNYDVAGLHFDYIRYPGSESCFCPGCRQRFEACNGAPVRNWPADVTSGPLRKPYLQFRRDNISRLVAAVSKQARLVRPGIKISAAVFPDWAGARDDVGQDWKLWVERGYLDFVCPMQYTDNAFQFGAETQQNAKLVAGKIPLIPGIGATLGLSPDGTLQQILAARRQGVPGFILFNYDRALLDHLDLLRLGATRRE